MRGDGRGGVILYSDEQIDDLKNLWFNELFLVSLFLTKGYDSEVFKTPRSVLYAFEDTRYVLIEAFLWYVCLFGQRSLKILLQDWNIMPLKKSLIVKSS